MTPNKLPQITAIYPQQLRTSQQIGATHSVVRGSRVSSETVRVTLQEVLFVF